MLVTLLSLVRIRVAFYVSSRRMARWTLNPFTAVGVDRSLIDFTLSNARRFYSSKGNPLAVKGLMTLIICFCHCKVKLTVRIGKG